MNIAMYGHKQIPSRAGGVEIVAEQLSTRMVRRGHSVTCYNRGGRKREVFQGVTICPAWCLPGKGLAAVTASLSAALRSAFSDAEVVHIHAEGPAFFCWIPKLLGKRVVVTIHGLDWQREKWQGSFAASYILGGERMAVRYADAIIVLSKQMQAYFQDTYGRTTHYIPNGVSKPEPTAADEISKHWGLEKDGYLLFLGRLVPEKGVHTLIEAFREVETDKKLVIAGAASDTKEYVSQLKALAQGDERICFAGFVEGSILAELYSSAYLYILPSTVEGMPLSLLEAMSYGNCCLVSDIPECTEVTKNHAEAFTRGDRADLREKLQALCGDPAKVNAYRQGAQKLACSQYCWETVAERTLELYNADFNDQ